MNEPVETLTGPDEWQGQQTADANAGACEEAPEEAESLFGHMPTKQRAFLSAFCETGAVRPAALAAQVGERSHYRWKAEDPEYAEAFALAQAVAADTLEAEAIRRARDGWDEDVFRNSGHVGTVHKYSDQLLALLLKGNMPSKYGDKLEHAGRIGGEQGVVVYIPDNGRDPADETTDAT